MAGKKKPLIFIVRTKGKFIGKESQFPRGEAKLNKKDEGGKN